MKELTKLQTLLIELLVAYGYEKQVLIFVSVFMVHEDKFQDILADALTERRLSEQELLQLMVDYIQKYYPKSQRKSIF